MSTESEANAEQDNLMMHLMTVFNEESGSSDLVSTMGVECDDQSDYHLAVGLNREPTEDEKKNFVHDLNGVQVKYQVSGP